MSRLPRVYMAGKVGHTDWRHSLFEPRQLRNVELTYDRARGVVAPEELLVVGGLEYAGPFFLGDDHGCFHGPHSHGFGALKWPHCGPGNSDEDFAALAGQRSGYGVTREIIQRSCLAWIERADVVFAWVNSWDAYGTLVELGYARARGIPIYLSFDLEYRQDVHPDAPTSVWNDWWFAEATATTADYDITADAAWTGFLRWWAKRGWTADGPRRLWFVE